MTSDTAFHEGEVAVQERAGVVQRARSNGRVISDRIPDNARAFVAAQPMLVVGSVGRNDDVWASVLFGPAGFVQAPDDRSVAVDIAMPRSAADDPLWENLRNHSPVGLLIIELLSRRRLRVNGQLHSLSDAHLIIDVDAAYANCPKYIQRRHWVVPWEDAPGAPTTTQCGAELEPSHRAWIASADTCFVASAHPLHGADVSHRGGKPGFIQVVDAHTLRIPDYPGNNLFNTLGNFMSYPHAGMAFVDFERGRLLQLSGQPTILWDVDDVQNATGGTQRYWQFDVSAWRESVVPFRLNWEFLDYSPYLVHGFLTSR